MAGNNPGTTDADLELSQTPSYSGRVSYALENGRVGLSFIYARLKFQANDSSHDGYGNNIFFEKAFNQTTIKSEAYYGENLANLGVLSIGKGTQDTDVK